MNQTTAPTPRGIRRVSLCSNTRSPTAQSRPKSRMHARIECLVRLTRVLVEAVFSLRHRLRLSACESDNCTITVWYQASLTMFKHPLPDRSGTSKVSDVCSDRVPGKAHQAASGSSYFVTVSAEAIGSCNRQLHYHRMVSGESHYAQTPAPRPLRHVQSLGCMLGESAWCWPGKAHQGTSWRRFFRYHVC